MYFPVNIAKFLRIAFFHRTPPVAASVLASIRNAHWAEMG